VSTSALLEENRALKTTLEERERALHEREAELARHLEKIAELERQIAELDGKLRGAARDKQRLEARLKELLARRRTLAQALAPGQLALVFGEEEPVAPPPCAKEAPDGETKEDRIRPRHVRKNAPREISYTALPREHVQHELPEEERLCPVTKKPLVRIGEKTTEELEYRPGKLVVLVHHHALYGLCEEDRAERTAEPLLAPAPARPIENGLAGAGLLARILVQKYCDHLPLYRQQAIFAREGLELPRQTMCDWVMACAYNLGPIQRALKRQIVTSGLVQLDDTPVQCQGGKGAENFQAYLWTYLSPLVDGVVFDFAPDRGHEHVERFLGDSLEGYLVGDGYAGYGAIAKKHPAVIEVGCWAHSIRKCREALEEAPAQASEMMTLIAKLFDVEAEAAGRKLEPAAVHALRMEKSKPVLERIREKVEELRGQMSDQGSFATALTYLHNQWPTLVRFLEDGRVPIHNNACEVAIRPIGIGRKNWLFAGSERGGEAAATIYSLIESCRRAGVEPFLYLRDVLVRVCTHPAARVHELVPARWKELFGAGLVR
jgi:transposase